MFLSDAAVRVAELKRHIDARNAKGIHDVAHALKGSCLNFGVDHVAALLQELEDSGETGQIDGCGVTFARIELELRILRPLLAA
jgi:HPt (histidine-containing phosphotransfer) domain-containing protein